MCLPFKGISVDYKFFDGESQILYFTAPISNPTILHCTNFCFSFLQSNKADLFKEYDRDTGVCGKAKKHDLPV